MTFNTILLFSTLTIFSLCNGQNTSPTANSTLIVQNSTTAIGDTVSEIDKSIWSIFQDKNNNFWFGSNGQGVYRYDGKTILHFTTKDGLCHNQIRRIQDDKSGNIYFTTGGEICKFDGETFTTLSITESNSSNNEWKIEPDDLWFPGAQEYGVVYRYDGTYLYRLEFPKTKEGDDHFAKFPRSKLPNANYSPYDVYTIYKDSKGNIWFGTSNLGVCRYDGKSFTWISEDGLAGRPVRAISEDKNGNFWFGNSGRAVYCYDGKSLTNFREKKGIGNLKGRQEGAPVSYHSIIEDKTGALWIQTYEAGVWRYDGKNITNYTIEESIAITSYSMYKDKQGDLWLGTNEAGVYKFNGKTFEKFRP